MTCLRTVRYSETFESETADVWHILVDWAGIADWMPDGLIRGLEMEGSGIGAVRHLETREGVHIAERLDFADERTGRLELSILDPLPWSMLSYRAVARLEAVAPGSCRLHWEGSFEMPDDGPATVALGVLLGNSYRAMFAGIRRRLDSARA